MNFHLTHLSLKNFQPSCLLTKIDLNKVKKFTTLDFLEKDTLDSYQ